MRLLPLFFPSVSAAIVVFKSYHGCPQEGLIVCYLLGQPFCFCAAAPSRRLLERFGSTSAASVSFRPGGYDLLTGMDPNPAPWTVRPLWIAKALKQRHRTMPSPHPTKSPPRKPRHRPGSSSRVFDDRCQFGIDRDWRWRHSFRPRFGWPGFVEIQPFTNDQIFWGLGRRLPWQTES